MTGPDRNRAACLERTRAAVLNVMLLVGAGILGSGLILRRRDRGALLWSERPAARAFHLALFGLVAASILIRRIMASRSALRDSGLRAVRYFRAHVLSAAAGALAIPLGFAYGWAVRPRLDGVAPFWVAAIALGVLAIPRRYDLQDLDEPAVSPSETSP
jgi:uncharacterized membrane protein YedE/YeeE